MKNFNELFETAQNVTDRRKKVFNQLIEKTKTEILPKFCDSASGFDLKMVYGKTTYRLFDEQEGQEVEQDWYIFPFAINVKEKTISGADYFVPDGSYTEFYDGEIPISDVKFSRIGIIEFVKLLNNRLATYIDKYANENDIAENL